MLSLELFCEGPQGDDMPVNLQGKTNRGQVTILQSCNAMLTSKFILIEYILIDNCIIK